MVHYEDSSGGRTKGKTINKCYKCKPTISRPIDSEVKAYYNPKPRCCVSQMYFEIYRGIEAHMAWLPSSLNVILSFWDLGRHQAVCLPKTLVNSRGNENRFNFWGIWQATIAFNAKSYLGISTCCWYHAANLPGIEKTRSFRNIRIDHFSM